MLERVNLKKKKEWKMEFEYDIVKALTLATLSLKGMKQGDELAIKSDSEPRVKTFQEADTKSGEMVEKSINLMDATNLETGEAGTVVLPFTVNKALAEDPDPKTGRCFLLRKGRMVKRCCEWAVLEITGRK